MADFSLAVADADQYNILLAGNPLSLGAGQSGYDEGEFFNAKRIERAFTSRVGADGSVARAKTNNRLVELHLKFLQTSKNNDFLSELLAADENAPNGAGIGSFVLEDKQGTTLLLCTRCWIVQPADVVLARDVQGRDWQLEGIFSVWSIGSN